MYRGMPTELRPMEGTGFLDMFNDIPSHLPSWLSQADLDYYVEQYEKSGFFGPVSWYRNLDANHEIMKDISFDAMTMPTFFIGGAKDGVIASRLDTIDAVHSISPNYRGSVIIPEVGHWTQQENPKAFNDALLGFLKTL